MGQSEIFEFLKTERLSGNEEFMSITWITKRMSELDAYSTKGKLDRNCVGRQINRMYAHGFLEIRVNPTSWRRYFRIKVKYLKENIDSEVESNIC